MKKYERRNCSVIDDSAPSPRRYERRDRGVASSPLVRRASMKRETLDYNDVTSSPTRRPSIKRESVDYCDTTSSPARRSSVKRESVDYSDTTNSPTRRPSVKRETIDYGNTTSSPTRRTSIKRESLDYGDTTSSPARRPSVKRESLDYGDTSSPTRRLFMKKEPQTDTSANNSPHRAPSLREDSNDYSSIDVVKNPKKRHDLRHYSSLSSPMTTPRRYSSPRNCASVDDAMTITTFGKKDEDIRYSALMKHRGSVPAIPISELNRLQVLADKGNAYVESTEPVFPSKYHILFLGASKVGKTAIVNRFLYDKFISEYKPTVEDLHTQTFTLNGQELDLSILDTSGSHEFPAMRNLNIKNADGFLLVYAIDDESSWEEVKTIGEEILTSRGERVPMVIVGSKADMEDNRAVKTEEVREFVEKSWIKEYSEVSAKTNFNVICIFKKLLRQAKIPYQISEAIDCRRPSLPDNEVNKRRASSGVINIPKMKISPRLKTEDSYRRGSCKVS